MIYQGYTWSKIRGGPVLKAVDGNFVAVGIHRGKFCEHYCCGTKIRDILESISRKKEYNAGMAVCGFIKTYWLPSSYKMVLLYCNTKFTYFPLNCTQFSLLEMNHDSF